MAMCLDAAQRWHAALEDTPLRSWGKPDLDIVGYFPDIETGLASEIDQASQALFEASMASSTDPIFLSTLRVNSKDLHMRMPSITLDQQYVRILRSVLMKPEQASVAESIVDTLVGFVESDVR